MFYGYVTCWASDVARRGWPSPSTPSRRRRRGDGVLETCQCVPPVEPSEPCLLLVVAGRTRHSGVGSAPAAHRPDSPRSSPGCFEGLARADSKTGGISSMLPALKTNKAIFTPRRIAAWIDSVGGTNLSHLAREKSLG